MPALQLVCKQMLINTGVEVFSWSRCSLSAIHTGVTFTGMFFSPPFLFYFFNRFLKANEIPGAVFRLSHPKVL